MNSKLISSKFQQKQSKDKELREEVNTNYLRIFFFFLVFAGKIEIQVKHYSDFRSACRKIF